MPDPADLLDLAVAAARPAADLLAGSVPDEVETKSSRTDLVTDLDRAAERVIVEVLLGARPDDAVLGEEGGVRSGTSGVRWILDPLDGTTNFVYGYPAFAVSIAAEVADEAVAGVVVDVSRGEWFTATRGGGARLDGRPLAVNPADDLATALIGTGFSYDAGVRGRQGEVVATVLPAVRDVRRSGSAALDLCAVAAGRLDGFWERGLAHWDRAAGALVASEAGATVGWLGTGEPFTILVAAPALYGPMEELLTGAGAAF